jgi:hypothetical protein
VCILSGSDPNGIKSRSDKRFWNPKVSVVQERISNWRRLFQTVMTPAVPYICIKLFRFRV